MKTSISPPAPSRNNRMVDAGRGLTISVIGSLRRAGLRLQVSAPVDARDAGQQVIHLGPCLGRDAWPRLSLRARDDHAALLQHVFAHSQSCARLLLVPDQRQMSIEQIVRGVTARFLR